MDARTSTEQTKEFMRLFLQAEPRIYGYIRSQVLQRADAEDILQETATVLWSKFDQFVAGSSFVAWACQVARFKVQHYHRTRGRNRLLFTEEFLDLVTDTAETMSTELAAMETALAGCMERLNVAERDIVCRSSGGDVPVRAIATELGRPVSTVKDILARARKSLYECVRRSMSKGDPR
jgi:RNA polymerase sigma-70 factor (ECF subfamily)